MSKSKVIWHSGPFKIEETEWGWCTLYKDNISIAYTYRKAALEKRYPGGDYTKWVRAIEKRDKKRIKKCEDTVRSHEAEIQTLKDRWNIP